MAQSPLAVIARDIVNCNRCARLRTYCGQIARDKKAAHRNDDYWGRPVPGFGDPLARVLVLGLAPAAHGANRTGRVFTGDGSGDFLMRAMHAAGFANIVTKRSSAVIGGSPSRSRSLCPAGQQTNAARDRGLSPASACRDGRTPSSQGHRRARPNRVRCDLAATRGSRHRVTAKAAVRPRTGLSSRGRPDSHRLIPSKPAEHEHPEAHAGDARRCLREGCASLARIASR